MISSFTLSFFGVVYSDKQKSLGPSSSTNPIVDPTCTLHEPDICCKNLTLAITVSHDENNLIPNVAFLSILDCFISFAILYDFDNSESWQIESENFERLPDFEKLV